MDEEKGYLRIRKCNKFRDTRKRPHRGKKRCPCPENVKPKVLKLSKKCKLKLAKLKLLLDKRPAGSRRRTVKRRYRQVFSQWDPTAKSGMVGSHDLDLLDVENDRLPSERSRRNSELDVGRQTTVASNLTYSAPFLRNLVMIYPHCNLHTDTSSIICLKAPTNNNKWKKRRKDFFSRNIRDMMVSVKYMRLLKQCMTKANVRFETPRSGSKKCKCPSTTKPPSTTPTSFNPMRLIQHDRDLRLAEFREFLRDRQEARYNKILKKQRKTNRNNTDPRRCSHSGITCFKLDRNRWITPPRWEGEDKCYCVNSNNNTFWCVRIINETSNLLYCEYVTGFIEYFDLNQDPHQLENTYLELSEERLLALNNELVKLRHCKGAANCHVHRSHTNALRPSGVNNDANLDVNATTAFSSLPSSVTVATTSTIESYLPTNYPPGSNYRSNLNGRSMRSRRRNKKKPHRKLLDVQEKKRSHVGRFRRSCKYLYGPQWHKCARKNTSYMQ